MFPPLPTRQLSTLQRVLLVALFVPAMLLMTVATLPAVMLLPFFPNGTDRVLKILAEHRDYASALFTGSATAHEPQAVKPEPARTGTRPDRRTTTRTGRRASGRQRPRGGPTP